MIRGEHPVIAILNQEASMKCTCGHLVLEHMHSRGRCTHGVCGCETVATESFTGSLEEELTNQDANDAV
jgi:hypothetical protein